MRKFLIASIFIIGAAPQQRNNVSLSFAGLSGISSYENAKKRFPKSISRRMIGCQPNEIYHKFSDGYYGCKFLEIDPYELAGYNFHLELYFFKGDLLKSANLSWPNDPAEYELKSQREVEGAYLNFLDLLVQKYGRYVENPPCSIMGEVCNEFQEDGDTKWHDGGERIQIKSTNNGITVTMGLR